MYYRCINNSFGYCSDYPKGTVHNPNVAQQDKGLTDFEPNSCKHNPDNCKLFKSFKEVMEEDKQIKRNERLNGYPNEKAMG